MISRKSSCRQSRVMLYVASHPFSTLQEIWKNSGISKNWPDLKHDLNTLVENNCLKKINWWEKERYYFPLFTDPSQRVTSILLETKDRIFSHIESKREIKNYKVCKDFSSKYGISNFARISKNKFVKHSVSYKRDFITGKLAHEQVLEKFLKLYFLKTKILLLEYKKSKKYGKEFSAYKKGLREIEFLEFLRGFESFLVKYGKEPVYWSKTFPTYADLGKFLDNDIYESDKDYFVSLKSNKKPVSEAIDIYKIKIEQTKKDASEKYGLTMKLTGNRIKPLQKSNGEPDYEKMYKLGMKESGHVIQYTPSDVVSLINISDAKKAIKETPKGRIRNKMIKETKMLFPGINLDD